jgi:hypothetical protein
VLEAADCGNLHDLPRRGELDRPEVGCVPVERAVGTRPMVVGDVAGHAVEVSLAENEHVIQTLAPDRSDHALGDGILPRAVRCREDFVNPHALHSVAKDRANPEARLQNFPHQAGHDPTSSPSVMRRSTDRRPDANIHHRSTELGQLHEAEARGLIR